MEIPGGKWSTGAIMLVIVPIAIELVVFQGIFTIVLFPLMTIGLLTLNLAFVFALVRPRSWETRIIGMLLGGLAGVTATILFFLLEMRLGEPGSIAEPVRNWLASRASSLADPAGGTASILRLIGRHVFEIEYGLLDLLGIAMIWAGARIDHRWRLRRAERRASRQALTPRDEPALTS